MLALRYARLWQVASAILLTSVLAGALMPAIWYWPDRVRMAVWFGGIDKWAHFLTFVFLAVWFAGQYRRRSYWRIAAGLVAFGFLIEACQRLVGYRSAEWWDIGADTIGIAIGLGAALVGAGGWCQPFESWLIARRAGETSE